VTFSPDGQYLSSGGRDQTVRLWSTESWKQLASLRFDSPKISALSFSPDGNSLVAGGGDVMRSGEVRMWDLGQLIRK
jgi:WD40 repeat protein